MADKGYLRSRRAPTRSIRNHPNVRTRSSVCDLTRSSNRAYTNTPCVRGAQADIIGAYTATCPAESPTGRPAAEPVRPYLRVRTILV
ncbi:hypothetical protein RSOLAG22IIIB_09301 [Rhizoctonia solani]|uniref:Uncharacterized protein n=1 Tax=Rhizoctonia solani TaxID=456999 RepID=A0A0K6FY77_9AGAM|nr:hypothetical protein RSOLAG22IIIB_09301 [Rhizoctonia solani]